MANSNLTAKWTKVKNYIKSQSPADDETIAEISSLVPESITITSKKLLRKLRSLPLQTLLNLEAPIEIIPDVIS